MTIEEQISYWTETAEEDLKSVDSIFNSGNYMWSLFIGHLVIEKILKAHFVAFNKTTPPKIHNLVKLSENLNLQLDEEKIEFLENLNNFQLDTRYPDYKRTIYKLCTKEFTELKLTKIKEIYSWLKSLLK